MKHPPTSTYIIAYNNVFLFNINLSFFIFILIKQLNSNVFFLHFIFSLYAEQSWRIRIDIRAKRAFSLSRLQLYVFGSLVCIISFTEQFHKNTSERGMYAVIYIPWKRGSGCLFCLFFYFLKLWVPKRW